MKKIITIIALSLSFAAHAGIPEVLAAEAAVTAAKEALKDAKKGLTKLEKAELAVAVATAKLAKEQAKLRTWQPMPLRPSASCCMGTGLW